MNLTDISVGGSASGHQGGVMWENSPFSLFNCFRMVEGPMLGKQLYLKTTGFK